MSTSTGRMTGAARREQLLDVAREITAERGLHALTVDAVARRAGISRPVVYGHYGDLDALLAAMLEREAGRALAQLGDLLPAMSGERDIRDRLVDAFAVYLRAVESEPVTWRLVLLPPEGAPESMRRQVRAGREAVVAALTAAVTGAVAGAVPDPALSARLLLGNADEMARLVLEEPDVYPVNRLLRQARWFLDHLVV